MTTEPTAFAGALRRRGKPMDMRSLKRTLQWRRDLAERHRALAARIAVRGPALAQCPVCDGRERERFVEVFGFAYDECKTCGHVFSVTPPTDEMVRQIYAEDEAARAGQAAVYVDEDLFAKRVERIARPKIEHVRQSVEPSGTWVDIGCATGEILTAASQAGWKPLGVEADPTEVAFARKRGLTIIEAYVTPDNASEYLSDAAVLSMLNILEHVPRPAELLAGLTAPLRSGAHVVLEVPRHPSLSSFANQLFPATAYRHIQAPEHLHIFSERSCDLVLQRAGLRAVSVWTFGQDFQEFVTSAAVAAGAGETAMLSRVLDMTPALQQAIDDSELSDILFVVARKV